MTTYLRAPLIAAAAATALALTSCAATAASGEESSSATEVTLWDSTEVHTISVDFDDAEYDAMIQTYLDTEEKEWIAASVTIDGVTYDSVGLKLKGNSSLRGLSTDTDAELSSDNPEDLPWVIRLDKYVDGQNHDGSTELVVRGNSSETSLNEALALELLDEAGLAAEQATAVRFSAAGSDESLRLVVENPEDGWMTRELGAGLLYKAETGGDYSYRGDDPELYTNVFDQEGGDDDLTPLIDFLQWLNESTDAEFASELEDRLDVDAFATYLAFQDLVDNADDIDGPGNNAYLYYEPDTEQMTVVNWDLNLAFGASPGGAGGAGGPGGAGGMPQDGMPTGEMPQDDAEGERQPPADGFPPQDDPAGDASDQGAPGGQQDRSNILVERFLANDDFAALYQEAADRLQTDLIDTGFANEALETWSQTLQDDASDLVPTTTIAKETEALAAKLDG